MAKVNRDDSINGSVYKRSFFFHNTCMCLAEKRPIGGLYTKLSSLPYFSTCHSAIPNVFLLLVFDFLGMAYKDSDYIVTIAAVH